MSLYTLQAVPVAQIDRSKFNPRKTFDPQAMGELVVSIRSHGVLQPLVLRPKAEGRFEVVAGERRFRAVLEVGLGEVPAIVRELTDQEAVEVAILENLQRQDVAAIEEAEGFAKLIEVGAYTVASLAERLGKSRQHVYNRLAMCDLPPEVTEAIGQKLLPASAGPVLKAAADKLVGVYTWKSGDKQVELLKALVGAVAPGAAVTSAQVKRHVAGVLDEYASDQQKEEAKTRRLEREQKKKRAEQDQKSEVKAKEKAAEADRVTEELRGVLQAMPEAEYLIRWRLQRYYPDAEPPVIDLELARLRSMNLEQLRFAMLCEGRPSVPTWEVDTVRTNFLEPLPVAATATPSKKKGKK